MYAYLTRANLGLPLERKSWLFRPSLSRSWKPAKEATSKGCFLPLEALSNALQTPHQDTLPIFSGCRAKHLRVVLTLMHYKSHAAVANRPHFGYYSLVHVVQPHRGIISARRNQLKDGIGRTICWSYFLVSISICSSPGRKIISSASTTILCTPVCCAQQRQIYTRVLSQVFNRYSRIC
jgi:hypothetical protein